jgi:hypothetical protein
VLTERNKDRATLFQSVFLGMMFFQVASYSDGFLASGTTQQGATPLNHGHDALSLTGEGQPAYGSHIERLEIENSGP